MKENKTVPDSDNYRDYVIKDGCFIGAFEEMYRRIDDPWCIGNAGDIEYDLIVYLIKKYKLCTGDANILDIGCGKGAFTARLKESCPSSKILGIDVSSTAIEKAREEYGHLGIDFSVMDVQSDYTALQGTYDFVILSQVMWYILPEFREIINHFSNVIKKGGYLLISQAFYKPGEQTYGSEIVSCVEDMMDLFSMDLVDMIEINRMTNHNAILLFQNNV